MGGAPAAAAAELLLHNIPARYNHPAKGSQVVIRAGLKSPVLIMRIDIHRIVLL